MIDAPFPLDDATIQICSQAFADHPRYSVADRAILGLTRAMPDNGKLEHVLAKVSIIKTLYATPLYDVLAMAKHIWGISRIDDMLRAGDLVVVDRIRTGHGIKRKGKSQDIDFYSFATKYCSFHNANFYPIFDNLVAGLIGKLAGTQVDGRDYGQYKAVLDQVLKERSISTVNYKQIDMGLWVYAKIIDSQKRPVANAEEAAYLARVSELITRRARQQRVNQP